MGIGSQLIVCAVNECAYHQGERCGLPQIEVSHCATDSKEHSTRCLSYKERGTEDYKVL